MKSSKQADKGLYKAKKAGENRIARSPNEYAKPFNSTDFVFIVPEIRHLQIQR